MQSRTINALSLFKECQKAEERFVMPLKKNKLEQMRNFVSELPGFLTDNPTITSFVGLSKTPSGCFQDESLAALLHVTTIKNFILGGFYIEFGPKSLQALAENKTITTFDLSLCINDEVIGTCISALASNKSIRTLKLGSSRLSPENLKILVENNKVITTLVLNSVTDSIVSMDFPNLDTMRVDQRREITLESLKALAASRTLTDLEIVDHGGVVNEGAKILAGSSSITSYRIVAPGIGVDAAKAFAQSKILKKLELKLWNNGDEGVEAFIGNSTLTTLKIGGSRGVTGKSIAALVRCTETLTALDISCIKLNAKCAKELAIALQANHTITNLDVSTNDLGDQGAKLLAKCNNHNITALNIAKNRITDSGAKWLAKNTFIKTLNVHGNKITHKGAEAFADNQTLTMLDISNNCIGVEGVMALARSQTLTCLNIDDDQVACDLLHDYLNYPVVLKRYNPAIVATLMAIDKNRKIYALYRKACEQGQSNLLKVHFPSVLSDIIQQYTGDDLPPIQCQDEKIIKELSSFKEASVEDQEELIKRLDQSNKSLTKAVTSMMNIFIHLPEDAQHEFRALVDRMLYEFRKEEKPTAKASEKVFNLCREYEDRKTAAYGLFQQTLPIQQMLPNYVPSLFSSGRKVDTVSRKRKSEIAMPSSQDSYQRVMDAGDIASGQKGRQPKRLK